MVSEVLVKVLGIGLPAGGCSETTNNAGHTFMIRMSMSLEKLLDSVEHVVTSSCCTQSSAPFAEMWLKSARNFSSYFANKQINAGCLITPSLGSKHDHHQRTRTRFCSLWSGPSWSSESRSPS